MAKFNIEVELDWVDKESGYTIDGEMHALGLQFCVRSLPGCHCQSRLVRSEEDE